MVGEEEEALKGDVSNPRLSYDKKAGTYLTRHARQLNMFSSESLWSQCLAVDSILKELFRAQPVRRENPRKLNAVMVAAMMEQIKAPAA